MVYCYNFLRPFVNISLDRCCSLLSHVASEYDSVEGCVGLYSYPLPSSCNCTSAGSGVWCLGIIKKKLLDICLGVTGV